MKLFKLLTDADIGSDVAVPSVYEERKAAQALVFDANKNIALLHVTKKHYHKLPGGGIEEDENPLEALKRECLEEIGCNIKNIREVGMVEEYRNKFALHQLSYCYIAEVDGEKGIPKLEEDEIADGFETVWLSVDEAIQTIAAEDKVDDYEGKFIQMRDLILLEEAKRLI